jgi:hypothetical protein
MAASSGQDDRSIRAVPATSNHHVTGPRTPDRPAPAAAFGSPQCERGCGSPAARWTTVTTGRLGTGGRLYRHHRFAPRAPDHPVGRRPASHQHVISAR